MNTPTWIVGAAIAAAELTFELIGEVRRIADDEIEALRRWDRGEVVGEIDRHAVGKIVVTNRAMTGGDCRGIDVRQAKRLGEAMAEQREADEARACTPFEHAPLARHRASAQKWDEILSELAPAAVQMLLVGDADPAKLNGAIRLELPQPRLDAAMFQSLPETQKRLQTRIQSARQARQKQQLHGAVRFECVREPPERTRLTH